MALKRKNKKVIVAVSGGFDPLHFGHVRMFEAAKKLGDELVVILNNDMWLRAKKGFVFMPQKERKEVIAALRSVDSVIFTSHKKGDPDGSVCRELRRVKPAIFANGGDRTAGNIPELAVCREIGARAVFGVGRGGKIQSSSWLLQKFEEARRQA